MKCCSTIRLPDLAKNCNEAVSRLERAMGIEPTSLAWEARVMPLYDARGARDFTGFLGDWGGE